MRSSISETESDLLLEKTLIIISSKILEEGDLKDVLNNFREISDSSKFSSRPHYSVISRFVNSYYDDHEDNATFPKDYTGINAAMDNIEMIRNLFKADISSNLDNYLAKITDHLTMENDRALTFSDYNKTIEDSKRTISELNIKVSKLDKNAVEAQNSYFKVAKLLTDSKIENITILSIFTGIVMSGMGMLSLTSNLFSELTNNNLYGLLALGCFCGLMLILFVYVMVRYIGKIVLNFYDTNKGKIDKFIIVLSFAFTALFLFCLWKYQT